VKLEEEKSKDQPPVATQPLTKPQEDVYFFNPWDEEFSQDFKESKDDFPF
jgi:hypothetical protein